MSRLPETTAAEFNAAVASAKAAFPAWRATPVPTRQRVMLKFQELIRANWVGGLDLVAAAYVWIDVRMQHHIHTAGHSPADITRQQLCPADACMATGTTAD